MTRGSQRYRLLTCRSIDCGLVLVRVTVWGCPPPTLPNAPLPLFSFCEPFLLPGGSVSVDADCVDRPPPRSPPTSAQSHVDDTMVFEYKQAKAAKAREAKKQLENERHWRKVGLHHDRRLVRAE